jgi:hypothetical protein
MKVVRRLLDLTSDDYTLSERAWRQLGRWAPQLEELTPLQRRMLAERERTRAGGGAERGHGHGGHGGGGAGFSRPVSAAPTHRSYRRK